MGTKEESSDDMPEDSLELELDKELEDAVLDEFADSKDQQAGGRFSLKSRRAIEDHLERRRLRKELDYLFDDDFVDDKAEGAK